MKTLDEQLATARRDLDALPTPPVPELDLGRVGNRRVGNRRRTSRFVVAGLATAAAVAAVAVFVPGSDRNSIRSIDTTGLEITNPTDSNRTDSNRTDAADTTNPVATSDTATATPDSPDSPSSTALDLPTTVPPSDGVAEVVPIAFGDHGLTFVPGVWGAGVTYTAQSDGVHVDAPSWQVVLSDAGPGVTADTTATFDFAASPADAPRLGPLGPRVTITQSNGETTASTTIGGRQVVARGVADDVAIVDLLRSVTTTDRVEPVRETNDTVQVPDVVGLDYQVATERLEALGVRVVWQLIVDPESTLAVGVVGESSPAAAAMVHVGSEVVLDVASGPTSRRRPPDGFARVVSPPAPPFDASGGGSFGFVDNRPAGMMPTPDQELLDEASKPVVFLHGELVGRFTLGGDAVHSASASLTDIVDPEWSAVEFLPVPALPEVSVTQTLDHHGVHIGAPATWTIDENGSCPRTRAIVVITSPSNDCGDVPAPWVTLAQVEPGLTPCIPGTTNSTQICSLDLPTYTTSASIVAGTDVLVTFSNSTDRADAPDRTAIENSLSGGSTADPTNMLQLLAATSAVEALLTGDCPRLGAMVAPESALLTDCADIVPQSITPSSLGYTGTRPTVDPEDLTHEAAYVALGSGDLESGWYVEIQNFYDAALKRNGSMIVQLTDPSGNALIAPSATRASGNTTLPPVPVWPGTDPSIATNSSVPTNPSVPAAAG